MQNPTTVTTGINNLNPTVNNCSTKQVNLLLEDCSDLLNPKFKSWYAQRFYSLPASKIQQLASQARVDGKHPAKLFSFLLKANNG